MFRVEGLGFRVEGLGLKPGSTDSIVDSGNLLGITIP